MEDWINCTDIIYEKSNRVATVTLNRPERMNGGTDNLSPDAYRDAGRGRQSSHQWDCGDWRGRGLLCGHGHWLA